MGSGESSLGLITDFRHIDVGVVGWAFCKELRTQLLSLDRPWKKVVWLIFALCFHSSYYLTNFLNVHHLYKTLKWPNEWSFEDLGLPFADVEPLLVCFGAGWSGASSSESDESLRSSNSRRFVALSSFFFFSLEDSIRLSNSNWAIWQKQEQMNQY